MTVHSFDVFDTCLVRRHLRPTDLFADLAEAVLRDTRLASGYGPEEIHELAAARIEAERRARGRHPGEDLLLGHIYDAFDELDAWGIDADKMRLQEIALELRSVRPIRATARRIEELRARGERIIFISDMYLGADVIRQMLLEGGIARPGDAVYVSGDLGLTKRSGRLFEHVLAAEGLRPEELYHVGDSVVGDLLAPQRARVGTELYTDSLPNRFEECMLGSAGDWPGVPARIAGVCRAVRLTSEPAGDLRPETVAIAAGVMAPLLTGYVDWVLRDARDRGLRRLYFLARDGQVLLEIARALVDGVESSGEGGPGGPELRYLYGSRQAWSLPAVSSADPAQLEFVLLDGQSSAPRHALARVQLEPADVALELARHGFDAASWDRQLDADGKARLRRVLDEPAVTALILERAAAARELTLGYFEQEGLLADDAWAVVDVGWTLRAQTWLRTLLRGAGQEHLDAYYLGLAKRRFTSSEYGSARGFFLEEVEVDAGDGGAGPLFENKGLIDQIFTMADHGTTRGYRRDGDRIVPDLAPANGDETRARFLRTTRAVTVTFAREFGSSEDLAPHAGELKRAARRSVSLFLADPRPAEVRAVAWADISDDPNELRRAPLARRLSPLAMASILIAVARRLAERPGPSSRTVPRALYKDLGWGFSWLEGSLAISGPHGRLALRVLRRGRELIRHRRRWSARVARTAGRLRLGRVLSRVVEVIR